jgi:hypothetical protein
MGANEKTKRGVQALFAPEVLLPAADFWFAAGAVFAAAAALKFFFDIVITSFSVFVG